MRSTTEMPRPLPLTEPRHRKVLGEPRHWRSGGNPTPRGGRASGEPPDAVEHVEHWPALQARRRRWAEWLRLVFQVDVEGCASCGGEARIIGFVTEPQVV